MLTIDPHLPFPNVGGMPLALVPAAADPEINASLVALHARLRAATRLAAYATYTIGVEPAQHHQLICDAIDELMDDQLVDADGVDELIILAPPGSAKSTYTSHAFASYFLGRYPDRNVICATHTADLSERWSRKVRNTISSPEHAHVFPDCSLSKDSTAVSRWATSRGGEFLAAGVGGSILGFRADCLTGNTLVCTKTGYTPISAIRPGDEVLAYDDKELSTRYCGVIAVAERDTDLIYRIHTTDGRVVEATGNHPFYSGGHFIPAMALAVGDPLLSSVWGTQDDNSAGGGQETSSGADPVLLQQVVLNGAHEQSRKRVQDPSDVQRVWEAIHEQGTRSARLAGLLGGLSEGSPSSCGNKEQDRSDPHVRQLRHPLSPAKQYDALPVLLDGVQEQSAQSANAVGEQPELAGWEKSEPLPSRQWPRVSCSTEVCDVPGQPGVRDLRQHGEPSCSPRGRERTEQLSDQRSDTLPVLSHDAARCGTGETAETTVARVEIVRRNEVVFDIQVEGAANFFANGLLVHNCVIVDDPISGFEQAQSITQLAKVHSWYETDLVTRMKPGAKLVLICQRLSPNDLAGYLIARNALNPTRRQRVLILRMEATADQPDPLGRSPGERLWPEWYTQEMVEDARRDDFKWRTLYQQEPPSDTGSWVSPSEVGFRPSPQDPEVLYGCTDLALSVNTGDYTVHFVVAVDSGGDWDIIDASRERVDPAASARKLTSLCATYTGRIREWLIDDDNASKVFMQLVATEARATGAFVPWKPLPLRGQDKETRAAPLRGMFKRHKVFMPADAHFTRWLLSEISNFPNALGEGVDDGIDALSLLGRRITVIAPAPSTVVPVAPKPKTWQDVTLNEMWEDKELSLHQRRRIA